MTQTALKELITEWEIKKRTQPSIYSPIIDSFINTAKAKLSQEKEQIIDAFEYAAGLERFYEADGEEYYDQTFLPE